jgi:hypothetical protein
MSHTHLLYFPKLESVVTSRFGEKKNLVRDHSFANMPYRPCSIGNA